MLIYEILQKTGDTFTRHKVYGLTMHNDGGIQEIIATYFTGEENEGVKVSKNVFIDNEVAWLLQGTGTFDKNGKLIFSGDILKDEEGQHYEVLFAVGAHFIVDQHARFGDRKDEPVMLLENVVRKLEIVGQVVKDYKLLEKITDGDILKTQ